MSTFTALNGGSPKTSENVNGGMETSQQSVDDRPTSQPAGHASKASGEVSSSQRDGWAAANPERSAYPSASYPDVEGSHKRKRSESVDGRREAPGASADQADGQKAPSESRDVYGTPHREYRQYGDEHRDREDGWYSRHDRDERGSYDHQQHSASSMHSQTEEQIGDALRRAAGQMDNQSDYGTSPDGDERSMMYGSYTPEQRRDGVIQSDPKKRKRNFSNRTKTGCLTCRRRKKKCDEAKPECSNCLRGGFVCNGYPPQNRLYQKQDTKAAAVPLESKDPTYVPPGAYGMPQQQGSYTERNASAQKREPLPPYRGQPLRIDPPQGRPVLTDDDRNTASTIPTASVASPDNKLSAVYNPASMFPTPISAVSQATGFTERTPKEYQRVPPLHDLSRTSEPETPHPGSLPQINILHPTRTSSPTPHPPPTTNAQVAAQLALSHTQFPTSRPRTQKEEMLAGRHYYPFDKELVLERERCNAACWRFNNSTNPNNGVSPNERARLFREILQPRDPIQISPTLASPVTNVGRVGNDVVVEAPFVCDYGYNITIGQNVVIGRNCTVLDSCEVKIGDNCHIGPNVSIYTATLPTDYKRRAGSKGPQLGRGITIGPDCWIGGGAIILPGRVIGKGSTIGAGSVVTKDVPPFTVVCGNPAKVIRGIGR